MAKTRATLFILVALAIMCIPVFAARPAGEAPSSAPLLSILILLVVVGLPAFGIYKVLSVKDGKTERVESSAEAVDHELVGIGGWLILPAIGLLVGPVFEVILLIIGLGSYSNAMSAEYEGIHVLSLLVTAGFLVFQVYVAVLFFRKRRNAPRAIIVLFLANLVASGSLLVAGLATGAEIFAASSGEQFFFGLIAAAIWIPYFRVSKRVKATFVH